MNENDRLKALEAKVEQMGRNVMIALAIAIFAIVLEIF